MKNDSPHCQLQMAEDLSSAYNEPGRFRLVPKVSDIFLIDPSRRHISENTSAVEKYGAREVLHSNEVKYPRNSPGATGLDLEMPDKVFFFGAPLSLWVAFQY